MPCVIDLFCGIGGLTKGLELAGLNVVAGIDFNESCRYAYETNNQAGFIHGDITAITAQDIEALFPEDENIRILVGCAPCQPFSKYTKRYRKEEKELGRQGDQWQSDEKWRLLYSFAELIRQTNPHVVSMENVPELEKEQVFEDFLTSLTDLGFNIAYQIAFCPDYGVPQNRRRLVLLASRLGEINLIAPQFQPENYPTVRDAIGELPAIAAGERHELDFLHRASRLSNLNVQRIQQSVPGGTWRRDWEERLWLDCHRKDTGQTYGSVYGRMSWDEPSPTITTQFYGYGNGRFGHPEQDRAISLREGALLQSFPADYQLLPPEGGLRHREIGMHIGNAVPVELGRAIGESILNHLTEAGVDA